MKNDLKDSAVKNVEKLAHSLLTVNADINSLTNFKISLETKIIDLVAIYDIKNEELNGLSVQNVTIQEKTPLKSVLNVFPNSDVKAIVENIVAEILIDTKSTEENLRFSGDFQEPIIKNIMKQLDKITNTKIKKVNLK